MLCHGSGDLIRDGCCYVAGQVCPLRWKVVNGRVYDSTGADLGTVDSFVAGYTNSKPRQQAIKEQLQGVTYICKAAVDVVSNDPKLLTNRPALNAAWDAHPEYVAQVRPEWERVEVDLGMPAGSFQCSSWRGTTRPQCCFAETPEVNDQKAAGLSPNARTLRQAGGA